MKVPLELSASVPCDEFATTEAASGSLSASVAGTVPLKVRSCTTVNDPLFATGAVSCTAIVTVAGVL